MRNNLLFCAMLAGLFATHPADALALTYQSSAAGVNGFSAVDKITWLDSQGLKREAHFAKVYPNPVYPQIMGYITRFVWQPDSAHPRIVCDEDVSGINSNASQGMGIVGMHMHFSQSGGVNPYDNQNYDSTTTKRDGFNFTQQPLYLGEHHLIFRVQYKQYTTLKKAGPDTRKAVDVTIDWMFADGLDYMVYALTIDGTAAYVSDGDPFRNDLRAPYTVFTEQSWRGTHDWSGLGGAPDGQGFGDVKRFVSYDMKNWTYGGRNRVPYAWQWFDPSNRRGDAEHGLILTESYARKQAGNGFNNCQDGAGTALPAYNDGNVQGEPYAFQMNYYEKYRSQRMTWGMPMGAIDGDYGSSPGYQNYSVLMMIDKFSRGGVANLLQESEAIFSHKVNFYAAVGSLVTSGDEGSANKTPRMYFPEGYNHVYRTWEIVADNNQVQMGFDVADEYAHPTFVIHKMAVANGDSVEVHLNGALLTENLDYWVSYDAVNSKVVITLLQTLMNSNVLLVNYSN